MLLRTRWASRSEAVVAIKLHSTMQNRQAVLHLKQSNNRKVLLECACKHGKGAKRAAAEKCDDPRFECKYRVRLRKSKAKGGAAALLPWCIVKNTVASDLIHSSNCTVKANIGSREALEHTRNTSVRQDVASIVQTIDQISKDNRIPAGTIKSHVANNVRLHHAGISNKNYEVNWSKLDEWGRRFMETNPGSRYHLEVDAKGRFKRMFVGLGCAAKAAATTGINFSGIDGTHFKGHRFTNGKALIIDTRDGENNLLVLALVICLVENKPNYVYFAKNCAKVRGLQPYLNRIRALLYSDRHKGIPAFDRYIPRAYLGNCIEHIIRNARDYVAKFFKGANLRFNDRLLRDLQKAPTHAEFTIQLQKIR